MNDTDEPEQITCVRCVQCRALPQTNLGDRHTLIFCEKMDTVREINLHGCLVADPRECKMKTSVRVGVVYGDRTRYASEIEKEYLRRHYAQASRASLMKATGRSHWAGVVHIANRLGLVRGDCPQRRHAAALQARESRRRSGHGFNKAQAAYIEECFSKDFWPAKHFGREPYKSRADAIRAELVENVNRMDEHGRIWAWESIRGHMKWVAPHYRKTSAAKLRAKRKRRAEAAA